jgi:hypothetical protein
MALVLRVISARAIILVALVMTLALFAWAMGQGTWLALSDAGLFAVLVFLPVLVKGSSNGKKTSDDARVRTVEPEHE